MGYEPQSDQLVCGATNEKESTKWHALPSTSAYTEHKILQHKNIPDEVNLYLCLKYSLLKSVLSWHEITQGKKENDIENPSQQFHKNNQ